jgi:hypothetical protein
MPFDVSEIKEDSQLPKKATLEVQKVIGDHLAQVSIKYSDEVNPIKTPVLIGDQLFKPGWNKGQPLKWALIGHFDRNGFGNDETELLAQHLSRQHGIIVQAWFNLSTLEWVGDLNHEIDFLVVGELPTAATARMLGGDKAAEDRVKQIENRINQELEKGKALRLQIMRAPVFLPASGIDLPKKALPPKFPGAGLGTAPAKPEEKPKEKDEGK